MITSRLCRDFAAALTFLCLANLHVDFCLATGPLPHALPDDAVVVQDEEGTGAEVAAAAEIEFFEKRIRPLLVQQCYECHSAKSDEPGGSLLLDSPAGWLAGGDNGPAVVPGDVEESLLVEAVRYHNENLQMPPVKPLAAEEVAWLERWIAVGAPAPDKVEAQAGDDPSDPVAGKEHWAFKALVPTALPAVQDSHWPLGAIDTYVLAQLEQRGLPHAGDADRRVLARRVYVQLIGIPPTLDELHAFLEDDSPDAYEQLVDRLLTSPRFGERWGRHWLDLARYADSNGLDENFLFREAWRYRNWVIDAVNAGMPYDAFVTMQLAGDLLPYDTIEQRDTQRIAAGFMLVGPKVLLGNKEENQRMEVADEQIDTIGRALLGQTLGCARCHNHKFDPVPTEDYYALAGIMASTKVMERRYMLGEQRVMEQLIGLGETGHEVDEAYEQYWRDRPAVTEQKKQADDALALLKQNDEAAQAKLAEYIEKKSNALAAAASDLAKSLEERTLAQQAHVDQLQQVLAQPPPIPPRAMIPFDVDKPADEHVRIAGAFDQLGEQVPRGFLTVLTDRSTPELPTSTSGRLELAQWLTDAEQRSGQLSARVLANRVWHHLLGRGLVRTVDNFGRTGEMPSHPALLDHLARRLIDSGWSLKSLVREIVLSHTFRMSSEYQSECHAVDPENRWLWRANRRRLDPESFRDAMLSAAQALDVSPMLSTVDYLGDQATAVGSNPVRRRTDFPCRSVYLPVIRNDLPELFEIFDFANPHTTTGMRPNTTVPTQGLFMLNDEVVMDSAKSTAQRLLSSAPTGDRAARIDLMYELILGATPTDVERETLERALAQFEEKFRTEGHEATELEALALVCHALFASSRFQFLE